MVNKLDLATLALVQQALSNPFFVCESTKEEKKQRIMDYFKNANIDSYFAQTNYISNSFISHVIKCEQGDAFASFQSDEQRNLNFDFGKAFEEACFGESVIFDNLTIENYETINEMVKVVNPLMPERFVRDKSIFGTYNYKGKDLKIKGKIDIYTSEKIIDLKTTKCVTLNSFLKNCESFGYFTQGYLYSLLVQNMPFELLAVSKIKSKDGHRSFVVQFTPEQFNQGKERFELGLSILEKYDLLDVFM